MLNREKYKSVVHNLISNVPGINYDEVVQGVFFMESFIFKLRGEILTGEHFYKDKKNVLIADNIDSILLELFSEGKIKEFRPEKADIEDTGSSVSQPKKEDEMTTKQRDKKIVSALKKGFTLREIADTVGVHNETVRRIGARYGVYSVRSNNA